jgi:hypothetical protein
LAASLLQEVRLKLDNLMNSVEWGRQSKAKLDSGIDPRVILEDRHDFIFDEAKERLLGLPRSVLRRVIKFYHLDDFHNIAMSEFRDPTFEKISLDRKLAHLRNTEEGLLLPAIEEGIYAELALRIVCELNLLQQRSFAARTSSSLQAHRSPVRAARAAAARRLLRLRELRKRQLETWAKPTSREEGSDS